MIHTVRLQLSTSGQGDAHDITAKAAGALKESGLTSGVMTVFVTGSTAAVTTIEFEPGAVSDFNRLFEQLAPRRGDYRHHLRWGDDNGSSHVRAALLGPSLTIPFVGAALILGTWQQIMMADEGDERIRATYGGNYKKLVTVKRKYDRRNLFSVNQNIKP